VCEQPRATGRATKRQHIGSFLISRPANYLACPDTKIKNRSLPHRKKIFALPDPFAPLAVTTDGGKFWKTETSTAGFA